ncbi:MAG: hypothetical protein QOI64_1879 [Solirubrobacteraceae bacterium]|nr:hypothetical protein [Solirubrobacteraceae bacterium]
MLRRRLVLATAAVIGAVAAASLAWSAGSSSHGAGDRAAVPACTGAAMVDLGCQVRRYGAIARASGVDAAFAALKRSYEREGFVRAACHPIVHAIGHAAVARHGARLSDVYARGDPFCSAGYFHGATEQIVVDLGAERFVAAAGGLCADLGGHARHTIYHRNCAHGIGHGFLLVLRGDLPEALQTCDTLDDPWEQRSCYGGVFMQNVMALGRSKYLRRSDPLYPCADLADRHRTMCYKKQAGYALFARNGDIGAVFALCARVDHAFRGACDEGLGTSVAVHHLKEVFADRDLRRLTLDACALGARRADRAACVAGAVRALINFDHDVRRAAALCTTAAPALRAGCRRTVREKRTYPE